MSWISYPCHHGNICKVAPLSLSYQENDISHANDIDIQTVVILLKIHLGIQERNMQVKPVTWYFKPLILLAWLMFKLFFCWHFTNMVVREVRGMCFFYSDGAEVIRFTHKKLCKGAGWYQAWLLGICVIQNVSVFFSWQIPALFRMALEIGLNREPTLAHKDRPLSTAQWMQHEIQRQLFWSIFSVDR